MHESEKSTSSRRDFLKKSAAAAAGAAVASFAIGGKTFGQNNDLIRVGLVGCGGRGTGAAENVLMSAPNVKLVAMADLYEDRLDNSYKLLADPNREGGPLPGFDVSKEKRFTGFDAYRQLIDSGVDYVILATPPGFRPLHLKACVDAGKHVFAEKPVAVDPVGARAFIAEGERAKAKGLGIMAGTQMRQDPAFQETVKRIHDGQIGEITAARCYFCTGTLWLRERKPGMSDMEWQTRNWYYFRWLSGDHIVEQHIHWIDMSNWVLDSLPEECFGSGGRQVRTSSDFGNIYDHFNNDYIFPNDIHLSSMCRQFANTDMYRGAEIVGTKGTAYLIPGRLHIKGETPWRDRSEQVTSVVKEHADLIASIRAGSPINVAQRIGESTLTAIMGREAAYTGKRLTWKELMESQQNLIPNSFEMGPLPVRPVPMPGTYEMG